MRTALDRAWVRPQPFSLFIALGVALVTIVVGTATGLAQDRHWTVHLLEGDPHDAFYGDSTNPEVPAGSGLAVSLRNSFHDTIVFVSMDSEYWVYFGKDTPLSDGKPVHGFYVPAGGSSATFSLKPHSLPAGCGWSRYPYLLLSNSPVMPPAVGRTICGNGTKPNPRPTAKTTHRGKGVPPKNAEIGPVVDTDGP